MRRPLIAAVAALAVLAGAAVEAVYDAPPIEARSKKKRFLKVRKFRPRHGRTFVDPDGEVRIRFNRAIDPETVTAETVSLRSLAGESEDWTYFVDKRSRVLIIRPNERLDPSTDYVISIKPGVQDKKGRTLKREKFAIFFTDPGFQRIPVIDPSQLVDTTNVMSVGRANHSAVVLGNGDVLLSGGWSSYTEITPTSDVFNGDRFQGGGTMIEARTRHAAAPIAGGALIAGGFDGEDALATTEIYSAGSRSFRPGPQLAEGRDFVAMAPLQDGRVLITGGLSYDSAGRAIYASSQELYDPLTNTLRETSGTTSQRRAGHTATTLQDGRVLIVGGLPGSGQGRAPPAAELFDPETETFRFSKGQPQRTRQSHSAVLLESGVVLLIDGGTSILEIFDPKTEQFFFAGGASATRRSQAAAAVAGDGRVLLTGGFDQSPTGDFIALTLIDVYEPDRGDTGRVVRSGVLFPESRAGHSASTLPDGRILFAGGFGPLEPPSLPTGTLYVPRDEDEQ